MGFRTPNFQQFQQPQQQKQFQEQDQDLQPVGKRQKGTGFTNIGKILGANVGAGERMGRQVGQAVGMQAGQARAGVTQAQSEFQKAKEAAEQKADLAQKGIGDYLTDTSKLAGMSEEEAKAAREQFLKQGQYAGPKGLEQEAQLKARASALGDVATMGMSGREGRRQLARSLVAGPRMYTRGQSLLDTALLGQSAAAQRAIEEGSRQALGAQQEIGKMALSAQEQAKVTESALSKQKADIGTKLAEKLTGIKESGGKEAKQFADDINRFNQLMTATKSVDDKGNVTYKDTAGNPIEVTERDKQLVANPEQFGLGASDIELDPNSALTKGILGDIAQQGAFTYQTGMKKYTPEQQAIARNLALFKGETPEEYKPFETDIYKTGGKNIADKSESYRAMQEEINKRKEALDKSERLKQFQKAMEGYYSAVARGDERYEGLTGYTPEQVANALSQRYGLNLGEFYTPKTAGFSAQAENIRNLFNLNQVAAEKAAQLQAQAQKYASPSTNLKNYLRQMYGLQEESQRDIPVQPRQLRQV